LRYFAPYVTSDVEGAGVETPAGPFPFVRFRGEVAFIGLATAVPRLPFVAAGELGEAQIAALGRALEHPEVKRRQPVVLLHHPPHNPPSQVRTLTNGLWDAPALREKLSALPRVLVLHGHLHERVYQRIATRGGAIHSVGATSASLLHEHPDRMAGINLYTLSPDGLGAPAVLVYTPENERFEQREIPLSAAPA
jgi:hypothetical protein